MNWNDLRNAAMERAATALTLVALAASATAAGCAADDPGDLGQSAEALTAEQCDYFAVDGTIRICHYTGAPNHPYKILNVRENACANAHSNHEEDYVAIGDPSCGGGGCLPAAAPCDETLPCCDGLTCTDGACVADNACSTEQSYAVYNDCAPVGDGEPITIAVYCPPSGAADSYADITFDECNACTCEALCAERCGTPFEGYAYGYACVTNGHPDDEGCDTFGQCNCQ